MQVNKRNHITGYMGCMPSQEERDDIQHQQIESHVQGYVGYIPAVKA